MVEKSPKTPPRRFNGLAIAVAVAVLLVVGLLVGRFYFAPETKTAAVSEPAPAPATTATGTAPAETSSAPNQSQSEAAPAIASNSVQAIGGPFTLVDQNGNTVTDATYRGKWMLIYFGYTFCPDVCPTTLNRNAQAISLLTDEQKAKIVPIMVTVDPERDTPKVMKAYVASFSPQMVGLTGTLDQVEAAARAYRVYFAKTPTSETEYLMDHSSFTYLVDPAGNFVQVISQETTPDQLADTLRKRL